MIVDHIDAEAKMIKLRAENDEEAWEAHKKAMIQDNELYEKALASAREAGAPKPAWEPFFRASIQTLNTCLRAEKLPE